MRRVLITHTDLDGVASGALIMKKYGHLDKIYFTQPHNLHARLAGIPNGSIVHITDIGVNKTSLDRIKENIKRILNSGGEIYWFDHHVWEESWIKELTELGVTLYVDRTTCSAGVVSKYLEVENSEELVKATCSVDLWLMNDWRGNFLSRYVGYAGGASWKEKALKKLVSFDGSIDSEVSEVVERAVTEELKIYDKALKKAKIRECGDLKIVYYFKDQEEHLTSYIANILMSRYGADVAVICRRGSVSLRSKSIDVRKVALSMGGGGHPRAAGAGLKPDLIRRVMYFLGFKKLYTEWCVNKVFQHLLLTQTCLNQPPPL
ncbi:MAG: DHHA1 domain-containing protein [Zestosphaera sp.]